MFDLVTVFSAGFVAPRFGAGDFVATDIGAAFGADGVFADAAPAAWLLAALAEEDGAIGVFELAGEVIVDFAVIGAGGDFSTAHPASFDGVAFFDPVNDIDIVDVLFGDVIAAEPGEVIPVAELVFHFGEFVAVLFIEIGAFFLPRAGAIPEGAHGGDVPDLAIVDAFDGFDVTGFVVALESDADFEIFLFGFFGGGEDAANAGGIRGDGFFHEDIFAGLDGGFEHHGAEAGRGGEDDDVGVFDGFFEAIEAEELAIGGDIDAGAVFGFEVAEGAFEAIFVDIGHGDEFDGAEVGGIESLIGGPAAATAATDEGDFEFIGAGSVGEALGGEGGEESASRKSGGAFSEEVASIEGIERLDRIGLFHGCDGYVNSVGYLVMRRCVGDD